MKTLEPLTIHHDGTALEGQIAFPAVSGRRPAVLVMSNAHGLGKQARERACRLAELGYVALATDMYGYGALFRDPKEAGVPFSELQSAPAKLRSRTVAWYDALRDRPEVDPQRVGAIGFCFGGQCVLELARSGSDVKAVVSYHGLLNTEIPARPGMIKGRVAVYTGRRDPYVPRDQVETFRNEMLAAEAQWQITEFGEAYHSFTDPDADSERGVVGVRYNPLADQLSWAGTLALLANTL